MFLGDELTAILDSIINGQAYVDKAKRKLEIGVDTLPEIPQDTTDRNRTSPLAFTGNKFEFRMLGSSQSIASPNVVLNTIIAQELEEFADILEQSNDFRADLQNLLHDTFKAHQRIIFDGNGYGEDWVWGPAPGPQQPAGHRGLYARLYRPQEHPPVLRPQHSQRDGDAGGMKFTWRITARSRPSRRLPCGIWSCGAFSRR